MALELESIPTPQGSGTPGGSGAIRVPEFPESLAGLRSHFVCRGIR